MNDYYVNNIIEGKNNKIIKELKALYEKKHRDETGFFIADGLRFVDEIPENITVQKMIFSESFSKNNNIKKYINKSEHFILSDKLFAEISETKNPQGIIAVCNKLSFDINNIIKENGFYICAEEINDPGNLGTIIRTAHAAGANGVFLSKGSVDIYNSKVLRSTMGSVFKVPVIQGINLTDISSIFRENHIKLYAAHLNGIKYHYDADYTNGCAFLLGNEARGLSEYAVELCEELIKIPMPGGAESLNASIAASILMYEVVKQRMLR